MTSRDNIAATLRADEHGSSLVDLRHCALRVTEGSDEGAALDPLGPRVLLGRHPWCDLVLADGRVSGEHCELVVGAETVRLRDRGSTNGIRIGGIHVLEAELRPGDGFRIGDTRLVLESRGTTRRVPRRETDLTGRLIGASAAMQRLFDMVERVADRELAVLLLGETGTGKTAVARALHERSGRRDGPFVAINCAALPPDLVESTLFGHVKGAFTGAHRSAAGVFQQADGGTLLLDEIGEMPLSAQPKLLHVLETGTVRPVGGEGEVPVDVRLATATHRSPFDDLGQRFREDLYYRIAGIELTVPPLRERPGDIPLLAARILAEGAEDAPPRPSAAALRRLESHSWPGNVRELINVLIRAAALAGNDPIDVDHVMIRGWSSDGADGEPVVAGADPALPLPDDIYERPFRAFKSSLLAGHERRYVELLIGRADGNITHAARIAEISRTHLLTLLRKHGLYERS